MKTFFKVTLGTILFATILPITFADKSPIVAGDYNGTWVGYDAATRQITGYYENYTGANQQFGCVFYFQGKLIGNTAQIESWYPGNAAEKIAGTLYLKNPQDFIIKLKQEHGGCWNVQPFTDDKNPAEFVLSTAYPWQSIRVVKTAKSFFIKKYSGQ